MDTIFDLVIIGGGPAGSAAAVYAGRKKLKTLMITSEFGGQSSVSPDIQNWIGDPHISGNDLAHKFENHVKEYAGSDLQIKTASTVIKLGQQEDKTFKVEFSSGEIVTSKTVLISTGSKRRQLPAKGADIFEHRGLTYCASCDGLFFADMDVVVVGAGNAAFESALQLAAYCKSVTIFSRTDSFRADEVTVEAVNKNPKIHILTNVEITEVLGDKFVTSLKYKNTSSEEVELPIAGIFVEIGQIPNTDFAKDVCKIDSLGRIEIDPWTQATSTPGIWSAGDCTNIRYHQNNIAAGNGVTALEDIYQYLQKIS